MNKAIQVINLFKDSGIISNVPSQNIFAYIAKFFIDLQKKLSLNGIYSDINVSENSSEFTMFGANLNSLSHEQINKIFTEHMQGLKLKKQVLKYYIEHNEETASYKFVIAFRVPYYQIWNYKIPYSIK